MTQAILEPFQLLPLGMADLEVVFALETRASDYSLFMTGFLPDIEDTKELFLLPDSQVLGLYLEQDLIGLLQVFLLEPNVDAIGLLLLDPKYRRQGLGSRVIQSHLTWATSRGIAKIVVSVALEDTTAMAFWLALGFVLGASNPEPMMFGDKTHVMQELELLLGGL
jgi:GNAT superfamily N-acetyltransferase